MCCIEYQIGFAPLRNDAWHSEHRSSIGSDPCVPKGAGCRHVFSVPALDQVDGNSFDLHLIRNVDSDDAMVLRRLREVRVDQNFEESACVRLRGIDDAMADRIPAAAMKHRSSRIEDRVTGIGDAVRQH